MMAGVRTRPPRDCPHSGLHRHGTPAAYHEDRCGCDLCLGAQRLAIKVRRYHNMHGRGPMVSAGPVRAHVNRLRIQGMGTKKIAHAAGVAESTVNSLIWPRPNTGKQTVRMRRATAERILNVAPSLGPAHVIDSTGTRRRIQALVAAGWCVTELARQMGYTGAYAQVKLSRPLRRKVQKRTAVAVAEMYERLWNRLPPAETSAQRASIVKARNLARRNGWLPPLAWDDDSIDDPDAQPALPDDTGDVDEFEIELLMAGERRVAKWARSAERLEAVRRLAARGMTDSEIGARLLTTGAAVLKVRERNDIPAGVPSARSARGIRGAA